MEIYLVRHGETEANLEKRYYGWMETPLTPEGYLQAEKVADILKNKGIEKLYCSDLGRARHTAKAIGRKCLIEPVASDLLREINFGKFEGMTYQEILASYEEELTSWLNDPFHIAPPEGEDLLTVYGRMQRFLNQLNEVFSAANPPSANPKVALVSHGGIIRVWLYYLLGLEKKDFWSLQIANTSLSLIRKEAGKYTVKYYNRSHCESEGA